MKHIRRLFNKCAAPLLLSATMAGQLHAAPQEEPVAAPAVCAAFPDFKKPTEPMNRISRNIPADEVIEQQQKDLHTLGLYGADADGRTGPGTRAAMRAFLILYAPLYGATGINRDLDAQDTMQLQQYADMARQDAKDLNVPVKTAAALRLAALRTGVDLQQIAHQNTMSDDIWLHLVKTQGHHYGLEFFAAHIGDKGVQNPFIHRQIIELQNHAHLMALMQAERIRHAENLPQVKKSPLPRPDTATAKDQKALMTLGFDIGGNKADGIKGTMTRIAMGEYQILYGSGKATGTLTKKERATLYADAARAITDAKKFSVPAIATGAIRMASRKNGADFAYMMELAKAESNFAHAVKASTSSATGLYQFIESTWHGTVKTHGASYGLAPYAPEIENFTDDYGRAQSRVNNPFVRNAVLELRKHPHVSALISADFQQDNKRRQQCWVSGHLSRTDRYLAHFLGAHDAVYFINNMRIDSAVSAVRTFPEAAEYNTSVFYETRKGSPLRERSLSEVFSFFDKKFHLGLYEQKPPAKKQVKP